MEEFKVTFVRLNETGDEDSDNGIHGFVHNHAKSR